MVKQNIHEIAVQFDALPQPPVPAGLPLPQPQFDALPQPPVPPGLPLPQPPVQHRRPLRAPSVLEQEGLHPPSPWASHGLHRPAEGGLQPFDDDSEDSDVSIIENMPQPRPVDMLSRRSRSAPSRSRPVVLSPLSTNHESPLPPPGMLLPPASSSSVQVHGDIISSQDAEFEEALRVDQERGVIGQQNPHLHNMFEGLAPKWALDECDVRCGMECCICQEHFTSATKAVRTPCSHYFHQSCLRRCFVERESCPTCRRNLAEVSRLAFPAEAPVDIVRSTASLKVHV